MLTKDSIRSWRSVTANPISYSSGIVQFAIQISPCSCIIGDKLLGSLLNWRGSRKVYNFLERSRELQSSIELSRSLWKNVKTSGIFQRYVEPSGTLWKSMEGYEREQKSVETPRMCGAFYVGSSGLGIIKKGG